MGEDADLPARGFTEREIAFAAHPLVMTNAARAARESGYSKMTSHGDASSMRKRLAPLIMQFQKERADRFAISKEAIQHQLAAIGFANILDYVDVDPESGEVYTKKLSDLTRDQAAAIQEYETIPVERADPDTGEMKTVRVLSKIRLFDKRSALVDLGKTIGLFTNNMNLMMPPGTGSHEEKEDVPLSKLSTQALEQIHKIVKQAAQTVESAQEDTKAIPGQCTVVKDGQK
jgi:phage terminase small subunit